MAIKPLSDKVLLKPIKTPDTTEGGIIIPETASNAAEAGQAQEADVLAVGNGRLQMDGSVMPLIAKAGDRVVFVNYGGTEVNIEGEDCLILEEAAILAILDS